MPSEESWWSWIGERSARSRGVWCQEPLLPLFRHRSSKLPRGPVVYRGAHPRRGTAGRPRFDALRCAARGMPACRHPLPRRRAMRAELDDSQTPGSESLEDAVWWETVNALLARGRGLAEAVDGTNLVLALYRRECGGTGATARRRGTALGSGSAVGHACLLRYADAGDSSVGGERAAHVASQ
jgi:hypothetical protein